MSGLEMVAITDPGRVRSNNEDSITTDVDNRFAVLADGMGGHQAGEVASGMAINVISEQLREFVARYRNSGDRSTLESKTLTQAIQLANTAIFEVSRSRPDCAGMGSTVVVTLLSDSHICIGHVGDSRLYRLRGSNMEQLTEDHSVVQELLSRGLITPEEAKTAYNKNLVTRALGIDDQVAPEVTSVAVQEGDLYLLCSDGLNDVLQDEMIKQILILYGGSLEETARTLVNEANARGGPDNISVILIRTGTGKPA